MKDKFNKGVLTRYEAEMTPSQIELCNSELNEYIVELGYSI